MTITLRPELEALIQKRLQSGAFESVDEVLAQALESQDAEAASAYSAKSLIDKRIHEAIEEFGSGGGVPASQVRQKLAEMKTGILAERG